MRLLLSAFFICLSTQAIASFYQDKLMSCLLSSFRNEDSIAMAKFTALKLSYVPELQDVLFIPPSQKERILSDYGHTMTRLYTQDCFDEAKNMVKYEGEASLISSAQELGKYLLRPLFSRPESIEIDNKFSEYLDLEAWERLKPD